MFAHTYITMSICLQDGSLPTPRLHVISFVSIQVSIASGALELPKAAKERVTPVPSKYKLVM